MRFRGGDTMDKKGCKKLDKNMTLTGMAKNIAKIGGGVA